MEYFDILDEEGNPTGKKKSREEVHRDGDWHRSVHVWIINPKHELLMQKRGPGLELFPGLWDVSVGGHVSAGDDALTTARREAQEELGLTLDQKDFEHIFTTNQRLVTNRGSVIDSAFHEIYLVETDKDLSSLNPSKEEVSEIRFIDFKELEKMTERGDPSIVPHPEEYDFLFEELRRRYPEKPTT